MPKAKRKYNSNSFKSQKVFDSYIKGWKDIASARESKLQDLYAKTLGSVIGGAGIFKRYPSITRVFLFGSLLSPNFFDEHSDIDLAYTGRISGKDYFSILNKLEDIFLREVNLVDMKTCSATLKNEVKKTGKVIYSKGGCNVR